MDMTIGRKGLLGYLKALGGSNIVKVTPNVAQALRAYGSMVDFKLTNAYSPTLFTTDGYQLVVMPMVTTEASESQKRERETKSPSFHRKDRTLDRKDKQDKSASDNVGVLLPFLPISGVVFGATLFVSKTVRARLTWTGQMV